MPSAKGPAEILLRRCNFLKHSLTLGDRAVALGMVWALDCRWELPRWLSRSSNMCVNWYSCRKFATCVETGGWMKMSLPHEEPSNLVLRCVCGLLTKKKKEVKLDCLILYVCSKRNQHVLHWYPKTLRRDDRHGSFSQWQCRDRCWGRLQHQHQTVQFHLFFCTLYFLVTLCKS